MALQMALQMALPTDEDLKETGAEDAGIYLLALQQKAPRAYKRFLETRRPRHVGPDGTDFEAHQLQPIWRCLEHLIMVILRTVRLNSAHPLTYHSTPICIPSAS